MNQPQPLSSFKEQLLQSEEIKALIASEFEAEAEAALERFRSGDDEQLWDLIENNKQEVSGSPEETIDAAGPDDDIFEIAIWSVGPVYWIGAPEFDDIGYFTSLAEARSHAEDEFESFITELQERQNEEDEEDEEEEEEE